jgi:putative ABC transport system permease protein
MFRDVIYAYRLLKKSPVSSAVIVVALALGIGANISMFTAVNSILLRPFSYPNLERIMTVRGTIPKLRFDRGGVAAADFLDFQQNRSFERLAAYRLWSVNILGGDRPEPVEAVRVTPDFFRVFGMNPKMGRALAEKDDQAAVLSEGLWQSRFAAVPDVIGRTVSLGGQRYTIVGVMPDEFDYPLAAQIWVPLTLTSEEEGNRLVHNLSVVGLLKPNVGADQAQGEMQATARTLEQQYPKTNEGWSVSVTPLRQTTEAVTNQFIRVLSVAALFLLLLAGANVANIQLARATNRRKSMAIEAALGAGRFRLARSLCVETVALSLIGAAVGLIAAVWLNDLNSKTVPPIVYHLVPGIRRMQIDATVVLFTIGLSLVTGVLCSLPAIGHLLGRISSSLLAEALSLGSRVAGDKRNRMRNILVVCEVALALLLLVSAAVMVNTFQHMLLLNLGFNPSNLLTAQIALPKEEFGENADQARAFFDRLLPELSAIPNVKGASADVDTGQAVDFSIKNRPQPDASEPQPAVRVVDEKYFETMQVPIVRGRGITAQDRHGTTPVIVISRTIADHYWPGGDPIGQQIHFGASPWLTIVGVCGDIVDWFTNAPQPAVYAPYRQFAVSNMRLLVRTTGDPSLAASALVSRVRALDPSEPVYQIKTMEQIFSDERSGVQAAARMMTGNAAIALFLAVTGIYGVISYFVSQRTREIGVRIALGAATPDILKMTLGQAGRMAGTGLMIGVPLTYLLMRVLSSILYNVVVVKWTTFSGVTFLLAVATLLAAYLPARRATAIDPVIALRNE